MNDKAARMTRELENEARLVLAARNGDRAAFGDLVGWYEPRIFRVAQGITRNTEDAEDVVQDTLARAFVRLDSFRGDSRFYTWLTRITINQALMKLRSRRVRSRETSLDDAADAESKTPLLQIEDSGPSPEELFAKQELKSLLQNAVGQLTPESQTVIQLAEFDELPLEEVSQRLRLNISTVKSRLLRARRKLREILTGTFSGGSGGGSLISEASRA